MTAVAESTTPTTAAATATASSPANVSNDAAKRAAVERAKIDASCKGPVLTFFSTAIGWLFLATLLGFIKTWQQLNPDFLSGDVDRLAQMHTWGWGVGKYIAYFFQGGEITNIARINLAYQMALKYGWTSVGGMGIAIWIMARLCRVQVGIPGLITFGGMLWNFGLLVGVIGVLTGNARAITGMELPLGAAWIMFFGYLIIGLWGAYAYWHRREMPAYISVWYLLGAFFWFPWVFGVSHLLASLPQVSGVMQNILGAWFEGSLSVFWFTAIGLAGAYYFIPKVTNKPVHSYPLASIGFWSLAIFGGLTSMTRLSGGPIPAWLVTVSVAATIMTIVPLATVIVNLAFTLKGNSKFVHTSPTVRFTHYGVLLFFISGVLGILSAFRGADRLLHFTTFAEGHQFALIYGFVSMVIFGGMYYITPRLVGCEWLSSTLIKFHYWGSAYGGGMFAFMLCFGGFMVGAIANKPGSEFVEMIDGGTPIIAGAMIAQILLAIGHGLFSLHFLCMLLRIGQPAGEPTLLGHSDSH